MSFKILDDFCGSPFWDSHLLWNSTQPDFTVCFEKTVLSWLPCIWLWVLAPLECYFQKKSSQKVLPWTTLIITRMILSLVLSTLSLINICDAYFNKQEDADYAASLVSAILRTFTFFFIAILMLWNKKTGRHTSGILFIFWLLSVFCEIFPYRSAFLNVQKEAVNPQEIPFVVEMLYFPFVIAQLILSCMADIKYRHPPDSLKKECPELSASFLSKLLFWWFNDMVILGWKRPLITDDLYGLNPEDKTTNIAAHFEKYYAQYRSAQNAAPAKVELSTAKNSVKISNEHIESKEADVVICTSRTESNSIKKISVTKILCKSYFLPFIGGALCKLVYDTAQFLNPLIIKLLIAYVMSDDPVWIGVLYAFLSLLNGCLQSVILSQYFHQMFKLGMRVRTALVTAIYKKSLVLSSSSKRESTMGEIVNLMSVDSQRFMELMPFLNLIWSAPLQIIVSLLMLFNILGYSVLAGLFLSVILIPVNICLANIVKKKQAKQMKYKDERVKLLNEVLSGIKVLKLYAWEEAFREKINAIRAKEVYHLKHIAYLNSVGVMLWTLSPYLVALGTFGAYVLVDENHTLDAQTAFVSLSLFNILRFPLSMLPHLITTLIMVRVSVKRINKFMNCEELTEYVNHDPTQTYAVSVKNGEFSWDVPESNEGDKKFTPTLTDINLNVCKYSLVAVVGQVGSGKSSLLSAILGEMEKSNGNVSVNGKIAYVSQQPWIQNSTLQNNILFSKPLSKRRYNEVIDGCGLRPDLDILPGGDLTEIGEKGINLSGGQKQRVSLARAVYSQADIYLLDDPLSAVDSHVGKHIFETVIGPNGLLRKKTRILVTHALTYLPQTDIIYVIKDGKIAERGSFQELVDSKGPFAEYLAQYGTQIDESVEVTPEFLRSLSTKSNTEEEERFLDQNTRRMSSYSINQSPDKRTRSISSSTDKTTIEDQVHKLMTVESAETGQVKLSVYCAYIRAVGYSWLLLVLVGYISWQIFTIGSNIWLSDWGNDKKLNGTDAIKQRDYRLGIFGGFGIAQAVTVGVGTVAASYGTFLASISLHSALLCNILRSPMSFFDTTPVGRIVNRFAKDIDTVDVSIPMNLRAWLSCLLQVIATLIVICTQTPIFLVVGIPLSVVYYFIQRLYLSTSRQLKRLESITRSPIYTHFSETLSGASTIRAYKAQERFYYQSNNFIDNNQVCYYPSISSNRWLSIQLDYCGNLIIFFTALFAVLQKDSLDPGKVGLIITYAFMITQTLNWMVRMSSELETNIVSVERILEYTTTPTEADWIIDGKRPTSDWPQNGVVHINEYSTRYREGLDFVLDKINCDVNSGEKVGIVGRTGAGKSSLTLSLFRIIEGVEGSIKIDEKNIADMGLHDLRSKITIIPQDPVLFSGTLRMNLDPFNNYSDNLLWNALEHAHLKVFVSGLDSGLEHEVVEGGENLSVGQRQLVCLARALLRKTKILVLDEATAAVDLETDSLIQATIRTEFASASVLTIAHRLNTVMDYDRILVLDKGSVAEFDTPQNLLKDKNSIFYGMAKDAGLA